ncbi:MAG: tyrosine-type recombinase/integrase, partial [Microvirga sp.]
MFVEQARSSGERVEYADELTPGLHLRVGNNGHKSWSVVFRVGGRKNRMTLGIYPALSLANARTAALTVLAKAQAGDDPLAERREKEARHGETVEKIGRAWVEQHSRPNNRSWRFQQRQLELYVYPKLGSRSVSSLRRRDIIDLVDGIAVKASDGGNDGHAESALATGSKRRVGGMTAADNVLRVLRAVLNWAVSKDKLTANPAVGVRAPQRPKARERTLSEDEIRALWQGATALGYPFGTHLLLCLLTGQRRTEVAEMRWEEVHGDTWAIPSSRTKGKRPHLVPLSSPAKAILDDCPRFKEGSFVLSTTLGRRPGFSKAKAERVITVEEWRYHDLRRTCATGMARLGVLGEIIARILNHATPAGVTNAHYNHYDYIQEKRSALSRWGEAVTKLVE